MSSSGRCLYFTLNGTQPEACSDILRWAVAMESPDRARVERLRPVAETIASASGKPVTLLRFTTREELEVIEP